MEVSNRVNSGDLDELVLHTFERLWVGLAGIALSALTEIVQNLPVIGRDAEMAEVLTDIFGVVIGIAAAHWVEPLLRRAESYVFPVSNR